MSTRSWRLRPGLQVTPLDTGLHLRAWDTSLTLDDAPQLWRLWQLLTRRLADGRPSTTWPPSPDGHRSPGPCTG